MLGILGLMACETFFDLLVSQKEKKIMDEKALLFPHAYFISSLFFQPIITCATERLLAKKGHYS